MGKKEWQTALRLERVKSTELRVRLNARRDEVKVFIERWYRTLDEHPEWTAEQKFSASAVLDDLKVGIDSW